MKVFIDYGCKCCSGIQNITKKELKELKENKYIWNIYEIGKKLK